MPAKVFSVALIGLSGHLVEIEADITKTQLGNFIIVGLPDVAVQESRERIRSAVKNAGFQFPTKRVAVNLAPADIKKQGPQFDVPIALAVLLAASNNYTIREDLDTTVIFGELALDGTVRSVQGILPLVLAAQKHGIKNAVVPNANAQEAALVRGITIKPVNHFSEIMLYATQRKELLCFEAKYHRSVEKESDFDMKYIIGQSQVKRALEIAAAGGHNILLSGPPGSGKSMLARTVPSILPPLQFSELIEVASIHSVAGYAVDRTIAKQEPPFRSPHHTASGVALIGGGTLPRPGEISLAHRGVLFLDELPEFPRSVLENLRQPLEEGAVTVARASGSVQFPADFMLIAAMNPCPCGYYTDADRACTCSAASVLKYQQKVSGPLLDRIDMHILVPRVSAKALRQTRAEESSADVKQRIVTARNIQRHRLHEIGVYLNAQISGRHVKTFCALDQAGSQLLEQAMEQQALSMRSCYRIQRVARTIADLAGVKKIASDHVAEAMQYRM